MCGIATISIGRNHRDRIVYPRLRTLIQELLEELQTRGSDASGVAVINRPNTTPSVAFKKPLRSTRLVVRPRFQATLEHINQDTDFVLLHARATTTGNTTNQFNNHPIILPGQEGNPGCVGIHNGTLYNYEELFEAHKGDFERIGEVDSELIFQLFRHYVIQGKDPKEAMQDTAQALWGAFTGAVVDWRARHQMVMFSYGRPLCLIRIPHFDIMIAISEALFFKRAASKLGIQIKTDTQFVHDGVGILVDLEAQEKVTADVDTFNLPVTHPSTLKFPIRSSAWLSSLMEVDPEDIEPTTKPKGIYEAEVERVKLENEAQNADPIQRGLATDGRGTCGQEG